MRRRHLVALLAAPMMAASALAPAGPAAGTRDADFRAAATWFKDHNNDVKFRPGGDDGPPKVGDYEGDLRRIRAVVKPRRILVKVKFDEVTYPGHRLRLDVFVWGRKDQYAYQMVLAGNMGTGEPDASVHYFAPGPYAPMALDCEGFRADGSGDRRWMFSLPKKCMKPKRFSSRAVAVFSDYHYDDGDAWDRFPRKGSQKFS